MTVIVMSCTLHAGTNSLYWCLNNLVNRKSLLDLIVALAAHQSKCFHLDLGSMIIAKTSLAIASRNRDYCFFEEFAFYMMAQAREKHTVDIFKLCGKVYAFDSTTIPLCLPVF